MTPILNNTVYSISNFYNKINSFFAYNLSLPGAFSLPFSGVLPKNRLLFYKIYQFSSYAVKKRNRLNKHQGSSEKLFCSVNRLNIGHRKNSDNVRAGKIYLRAGSDVC